MKLRLFQQKKKPVGMVLTDTALRYTEVRVVGGQVQVKQAGCIELEPGCVQGGHIADMERLLNRLKTGLKRTRLRDKKIILSVPTSGVVIRQVPLPKLPAREVRPLLEVELESTIHLPFSRPYFDFHKLDEEVTSERETEDGKVETVRLDQYMVVAAPGEWIDSYMQLFEALNLELSAVDIEPLALQRLLMTLETNIPAHTMYMQFDKETLNVSFFNGTTPEFIRNIPVDLTASQIPSKHIGVSSSDQVSGMEEQLLEAFVSDITREVERVINFYQFSMKNDGTRVQAMYVTGTFPDLQKIVEVMRKTLPAIDIFPFATESILHPFFDADDVQAYTIPIGLSMKG